MTYKIAMQCDHVRLQASGQALLRSALATRVAMVAVALSIAGTPTGPAQAHSSRPITMIVPFAAGGAAHTIGLIIGERMRTSLGQPIIVEPVPGAGSTLGVGRAARATPDGYTLSLGNWSSHVGSGALYPVHYDLLKDFEPVSLLTFAPMIIVGKKALPATDGKGLIAWLKANPDKASAASVGAGSALHVCGLYFQARTGTQFEFVTYKGAAPAMQDLVGGQIDLMCAEASQVVPHVRSGKIKAFAVMSQSRLPELPDVPTTDEIGAPGMHIPFWHGLWAPKGTPKDVIAKLNAAVVETLSDPAVRKRLTDQGWAVASREQQTPEALGAYHQAEIKKWWPIIKAANITPQ